MPICSPSCGPEALAKLAGSRGTSPILGPSRNTIVAAGSPSAFGSGSYSARRHPRTAPEHRRPNAMPSVLGGFRRLRLVVAGLDGLDGVLQRLSQNALADGAENQPERPTFQVLALANH